MKRILHVWIVNYKSIDYSNGQIIALSLNILEFYDFFFFYDSPMFVKMFH